MIFQAFLNGNTVKEAMGKDPLNEIPLNENLIASFVSKFKNKPENELQEMLINNSSYTREAIIAVNRVLKSKQTK